MEKLYSECNWEKNGHLHVSDMFLNRFRKIFQKKFLYNIIFNVSVRYKVRHRYILIFYWTFLNFFFRNLFESLRVISENKSYRFGSIQRYSFLTFYFLYHDLIVSVSHFPKIQPNDCTGSGKVVSFSLINVSERLFKWFQTIQCESNEGRSANSSA